MRKFLLVILIIVLSVGLWIMNSGVTPRPEDAVIRGINYVGVTVSNLEQTTALYGDAVDLTTVDERPLEGLSALINSDENMDAMTRLMRGANAQIRFMQFASPSDAAMKTPKVEVNGPGIAHIAFQVAKKTEAYDRFLARGATPVAATTEMAQLNPRNPVQYAYARDGDQTMYEFEHVDIAKLNLDTPPKNNYRIRHVALATPDFDRAVKFYSVLLEQKRPRRLGRLKHLSGEMFDQVSGLEGAELKMAFFQVRNMELEIAEYVSHPTEIPSSPRPLDALGHNMIVFDVEDIAAAQDKLMAAGGTIVGEAKPMDGGMILFARDLDNNLLGFQQFPADSVFSSQNFANDGT